MVFSLHCKPTLIAHNQTTLQHFHEFDEPGLGQPQAQIQALWRMDQDKL